MKTLIPMTYFVLENAPKFNPLGTDEQAKVFENIVNYAKFLKQPLTLGMFVPTDANGNVLVEPGPFCPAALSEQKKYYDYKDKYSEAKERVLFYGFVEYKDGKIGFPSLYHSTDRFYDLYIKDRVVEDLLGEMFEHTLTPTAIKQIGL